MPSGKKRKRHKVATHKRKKKKKSQPSQKEIVPRTNPITPYVL